MEQRKLNEVFILLISKQTDTRVWVVHFGLCTLYYNICPIDLNELQALLHYDKTWDTFHKIAKTQRSTTVRPQKIQVFKNVPYTP